MLAHCSWLLRHGVAEPVGWRLVGFEAQPLAHACGLEQVAVRVAEFLHGVILDNEGVRQLLVRERAAAGGPVVEVLLDSGALVRVPVGGEDVLLFLFASVYCG